MDMSSHPLLAVLDEPPPFPEKYPQLRRLDRSVVCQICKEPFTAPVSIACGHSFCSHCIRSSLDVSKKCPSCNENCSEGSIRRNRALEEITDAWDESRPTLIELTRHVPTSATTRKRPAPEPNSKASSSSGPSKRVKANANANGSRSGSQSRSASPSKPRSKDSREEEEVEEDDEDEVQELTENDEAPCPLCQATMPISSIPLHIEKGCPPPKTTKKVNGVVGKGNQKSDWKKVFSGQGLSAGKGKEVEMKRITKPNYALATPADLRATLAEYSLPTTGDKLTLTARLQEWIILFNANLDTSHPSSLSALRAKLTEAENSRKRDKERGKDEMVHQLGTKEGLEKYAKDKKGEFERLKKEIMERDKRRAGAGTAEGSGSGTGKENAIEVE
ncbi:DNA repair protein rad18 [Kwoniella shandongensis]|uniref:Postreplication repair E3 ubiquitin-protein ligase RAD18 n=1 Tax=Kwoniella shandongensis TaxID=1734106 RepID=A0A5M6BVT0_9TREE|nr:DNA repair protein rad18 [Kwoniella shandongensis]KAA5526180.1 DNA repair protein rad18 [Kwoniella shandongensis]